MSEVFKVVFLGVLPGFERNKVEADFAQLFSLDAVRAARIFDADRATLKSNISYSVAEQYIARLAAIGVEAVAEAMEPQLAVAPQVPESAPATAPGEQLHKFEFKGRGVEYFKIWIVNVLLSIATLGIYSAWAKVRTHQYFYGNTLLNGSSFEYTAKPLNILKGRMIALVLLATYSALVHLAPLWALGMALVLLIATPWIVVLSLRFNARYTSYRNIGFHFDGSLGGAAKAFIFWPLFGIFTFGIFLPFAWQRQARYVVANHRYGKSKFSFNGDIGEYYKILLILIAASFIFFIVFVFIAVGMGMAVSAMGAEAKDLVMVPAMFLYLLFYLFAGAYFVVGLANILYNNTRLDEHRFSANWELLSYAKLLFVNTLLILLTLGLYIPFAKVRTAAYKAEHTQFIAADDLSHFAADDKEQVNSVADGVNDLFAMDISI